MAVSRITTSQGDCVKAWSELFFRDEQQELFWDRYTGEGANNIIQMARNLEKGPGDRITFTLLHRLTGGFIKGSSGLSVEGREQSLSSHTMNLTLEEYKLAVRWANGLDLQRGIWNMPEEARKALMINVAEQEDQLTFDALLASPTRVLSGAGSVHTTAAAAALTLTATTKITPDLVRHLKAIAKTGIATTSTSDGAPARVINPLRPIRIQGKDHYLLVIPPYSTYDMGSNSTYHQTLREAIQDYKQNPLFIGGVAMIDDVILVEHASLPMRSDGGAGSDVAYGKALFLGAQAGVKAYGSYRRRNTGKLSGNTIEVIDKSFGYDEEAGTCAKLITEVAKSQFNSLDFGVIHLFATITNLGA